MPSNERGKKGIGSWERGEKKKTIQNGKNNNEKRAISEPFFTFDFDPESG